MRLIGRFMERDCDLARGRATIGRMSPSPDFADAITFALAHEVGWPREPGAEPLPGQTKWGVHHDDPPPYNRLRGPVHARGGVSGVVWQHGRELAAWGDPERADLTFSVAKTYLALLAGVAHGDGLLPSVDEPVLARVKGIGFEGEHNRAITWRHLLEQTSEWEGTCLGIPDTVDRWRVVSHDPRPQLAGKAGGGPAWGPKGGARPLQAPGTYWEYNDVRINQLSLALLHLFRRPLPEVFGERLMQPLGATSDWAWRPYDDAWVDIDGRRLPSVPGGTHWGAGVSIGARDQARVAQLLLAGGRHDGRALLPESWVAQMPRPCAIAPFYGWLVWLNPEGRNFPGASAQAWLMVGAGGHYVWIEPTLDAVVVVRWLDSEHLAGFMQRVRAGLQANG
jgi:CubicO group peptidase (beta-lactamase class C family)